MSLVWRFHVEKLKCNVHPIKKINKKIYKIIKTRTDRFINTRLARGPARCGRINVEHMLIKNVLKT